MTASVSIVFSDISKELKARAGEEENSSNIIRNRLKLVFFVKQGMDSFIKDIIKGLSEEYEIKKIIVTVYGQIDEGMEWADICWFEWCDELIEYGSKLELAKKKIIICRLHSYEAFTDYIQNVCWDNVDKVIFVGEHIKDIVLRKVDKYNQLSFEDLIIKQSAQAKISFGSFT